ncbi:hypothetical protein ABH920_004634 [Catenulispora sp. EB89]
MAPLYAALETLTCAPDWETFPFHSWVIVCPAPNDHVSRQVVTGSPWSVTLMFVLNPPDHWLDTV